MVGRRKLLQVGGSVLASSSLAGCSYFDDNRSTSLSIANHSQERETVRVTVFDDESDTRSSLFSKEVELAPIGDDSNSKAFRDAFEAQRALVEVRTTRSEMQEQFVYQPSPACAEDERDELLGVRFNNPYSINWDVACESE